MDEGEGGRARGRGPGESGVFPRRGRGGGGGGEVDGVGEEADEEGEEEEEEEEEQRITLRLDGSPQRDWSFELRDLPDGSALAVALGPPSAVVDAGGTFSGTLGRAAMSTAEVEEAQ